jgi:NADH-quinone oxidoreductase subunit G
MATIEIDGKEFEVENGKMIIEVADDNGIKIPRFCYHKKLSVAANCRMCLVEIENGRKPVPACATPITDGMKVFTKSEMAIKAQKAVMEFLLINHPLDCPICDQGGECELQDVSMGYGYDESEYDEEKRSVEDDNLGPLIATEMTRCIHCTRCVRFGEEVAGLRELGATGRGENTQIGTFIKHSIVSEVSGNVIDLCPVGALTSKPYRFTARAWELTQHESIAPHDCLGSNIYMHVRRDKLMRVVPRENEQINETWISDRDRFSYTSLLSKARLAKPMIKQNGLWQETDWQTALTFAVSGMQKVIKQHGPEQMAAFATPSSTLEELYLLQKLMREIGVNNIDHRLHQVDFSDQDHAALMPGGDMPYAELTNKKAILLVGCDIQREVPLAGLRIRKAGLNGAKIMQINPVDYKANFEFSDSAITSPSEMVLQLARLAVAVCDDVSSLPQQAQKLLLGVEPDDVSRSMAEKIKQDGVIVTGLIAENHPHASILRSLCALIQRQTDAKLLRLTLGANSAGAHLVGMLPHRAAFGRALETKGLDVQAAISQRLKGYFLMGVEPGFDFDNPHQARKSMLSAEFVVLMSPFFNDSMQDYADVILPMAPFAETSGTYINIDQQWQSFNGVVSPNGEARPAWKILRVLGNLFDCKEFEYTSSKEVLSEIERQATLIPPVEGSWYCPDSLAVETHAGMQRVSDCPLYRCDAIVRNASALQECAANDRACIRVHPETASRLKLDDEVAIVSQGEIEITLPLKRDERVAKDVVWVANGFTETADLGHSFAAITIKR